MIPPDFSSPAQSGCPVNRKSRLNLPHRPHIDQQKETRRCELVTLFATYPQPRVGRLRRSFVPLRCWPQVFGLVALPPVPGEGDEAADHVGGQPRSARDVPQRRVLMLGRPGVRRPPVRPPPRQYPPARAGGPAEPVLDHAEGAGGNALPVLELSQCPLGYPGRRPGASPVPARFPRSPRKRPACPACRARPGVRRRNRRAAASPHRSCDRPSREPMLVPPPAT